MKTSPYLPSVFIALVMIFAALYAAITVVFAPISYLNLQLRLSEILIAFIPFYGLPVVLGLTLGTFIANTLSPLGIIDLLVGTTATFLGCLPIYAAKNRRPLVVIGFFAYAIIVSLLVAFELTLVLALPFELMLVDVLAGELVSAGLGATITYLVLQRTQLPQALPPDQKKEEENR